MIMVELEQTPVKHGVIFSEDTANVTQSVSQHAGQDCWLCNQFSGLSQNFFLNQMQSKRMYSIVRVSIYRTLSAK